MKRILVFVGLVVPAMLWAQSGVVARHPQGQGEKMLTMEEAVLGRNVRPSSVYARWTGPDTYACFMDRKWQNFDVKSGEASEYVAATLPAGIPEDAANLTESPDGNFAYTLGKLKTSRITGPRMSKISRDFPSVITCTNTDLL